jgi:uncharacterized membrane protein
MEISLTMKKCSGNKEHTGIIYILFILSIFTVISAPGFCYFYFYRDRSVIISLIGGSVGGFFAWSTFSFVFGMIMMILDRVKK